MEAVTELGREIGSKEGSEEGARRDDGWGSKGGGGCKISVEGRE